MGAETLEPSAVVYSIVVPARDEEESVEELHGELRAAFDALGGEFELIFVDDGSRDATLARLEAVAAACPRTRVLRLPSGRGKSAAYAAGFGAARGEVVLTLDADLQDDPAEAPKLLERLEGGADLVIGWKEGRIGNEPTKTIASRLYNWLKGRVFGLRLRDSNSGFRAMRRDVARALHLYGDRYRFLPELAHLAGFRVAEVAVRHRPRRYGASKFGPQRFWTGLLDVLSVRFLTGYVARPLHFFGTVGLVPALAGAGLEVYVLVQKLSGSAFQTHVAAIVIGAMLIILGFQVIVTGLIGEMIAGQARARPAAVELAGRGPRPAPPGRPAPASAPPEDEQVTAGGLDAGG